MNLLVSYSASFSLVSFTASLAQFCTFFTLAQTVWHAKAIPRAKIALVNRAFGCFKRICQLNAKQTNKP